MRKLWMIALLVVLARGFVVGQQTSAPSLQPDVRSERVKVFAVGPGVTAPELLPLRVPDIPNESCKDKLNGKVVLSVIVDAAGLPRNITFLHPLGTDLDKLALLIASSDRFKPGIQNGTPVAVAESLALNIQSCHVHTGRCTSGSSQIQRKTKLLLSQVPKSRPGAPRTLRIERPSGALSPKEMSTRRQDFFK